MNTMTDTNIVLATDSYKLTHHAMYPEGTEFVYSYFESRKGSKWDHTVFFGLQHLLQTYLADVVVYPSDVREAADLAEAHFGDASMFNKEGWLHVAYAHNGRLPLRIKAVPEGTVVPVGNVLMTVENTCPKCFWLTNFVESLLTHIWYPSTVATLSHSVKQMMADFLRRTSDSPEAINFMLHDFGYRGATTHEAAAIGGAAHLINFMGTDTLPAMQLLMKHYSADPASLAFSVPASEHSVMTATGRTGEYDVLDQLLRNYPSGILSVVADSYDIYAFTDEVIRRKDQILARDGRFVLRPDSVTEQHETPARLTINLVRRLWDGFGGTLNSKGFKVLNDQVRVLWGDGIDPEGIYLILDVLEGAGFSAENMVFGMGGGLLQKVNRDTQRFAFKSSAQYRNGEWHDVQKMPLDTSKASKAGRLKLIHNETGGFLTVRVEEPGHDFLDEVFLNGQVMRTQSLDDIRTRAAI
jgi:nicotinamide phosphoribosyltransferase